MDQTTRENFLSSSNGVSTIHYAENTRSLASSRCGERTVNFEKQKESRLSFTSFILSFFDDNDVRCLLVIILWCLLHSHDYIHGAPKKPCSYYDLLKAKKGQLVWQTSHSIPFFTLSFSFHDLVIVIVIRCSAVHKQKMHTYIMI